MILIPRAQGSTGQEAGVWPFDYAPNLLTKVKFIMTNSTPIGDETQHFCSEAQHFY